MLHLERVFISINSYLPFREGLDGPDAAIAAPAPPWQTARSDLLPEHRHSAQARGLLRHLLMAALQRAVALAEMDRMALAVAQDLDSMWRGLPEIFSR